MPIHRPDTVEKHENDGEKIVTGPYASLRFSDAGGLTQFGVHVETLPPGSFSSIKHWHENEDEMIYVLDGELLLHEGDDVSTIRAGEAATFKAGVPLAHCLENASDATAKVLVIGTRLEGDVVTFPDHDRKLTSHRAMETYSWTTQAGDPADNPYLKKE